MIKQKFSKILKYIIFSLIPLACLLLLMETGLRVAGYQYSNTPLEVRKIKALKTGDLQNVFIAHNRGGVTRTKKDSKQFWVPAQPFAEGISIEKTPGVVRIANLGGSCTFACVDDRENYPTMLREFLNRDGKKAEVINAGVGSHSSYQGLQRLKYTVLEYQPDIITVLYGWNDHWITYVEDKKVKMPNEFVTQLVNVAEHLRTYQLMNYFLTKSKQLDQTEGTVRVTREDYAYNLNAMIDIAHKHNIKVLLITSPYTLKGFKPTSFFPFPRERAVAIHRAYNAVVRKVAKARDVPLLDLEALVNRPENQKIISEDGIHFSSYGCETIAKLIAFSLEKAGWLQ